MTIHDQARVMANKGTSMSRALIYLHIYLDKDCNEAPQAHACRPLGRMNAGPRPSNESPNIGYANLHAFYISIATARQLLLPNCHMCRYCIATTCCYSHTCRYCTATSSCNSYIVCYRTSTSCPACCAASCPSTTASATASAAAVGTSCCSPTASAAA